VGGDLTTGKIIMNSERHDKAIIFITKRKSITFECFSFFISDSFILY